MQFLCVLVGVIVESARAALAVISLNRKLSKLSTIVTILEHASNNINRTTFFENVIKTIKTRRMENDLLTTDLPPTSSYEDGQ